MRPPFSVCADSPYHRSMGAGPKDTPPLTRTASGIGTATAGEGYITVRWNFIRTSPHRKSCPGSRGARP